LELTTNGAGLTEEMLDFFSRHHFSIVLDMDSFDGDGEGKQRIHREMAGVMKKVRDYPDICFEIKRVFTPETVGMLSQSLRYMLELGIPGISFDLSTTVQWGFPDLIIAREELQELSDYLVWHYQETGEIPVKNFQVEVPFPPGDADSCMICLGGTGSNDKVNIACNYWPLGPFPVHNCQLGDIQEKAREEFGKKLEENDAW
ncbi:MAG: hypothetical protein GY940_37130, partial [bacterium]|nr:hypothetical protein [bacterium]